MPRAKRVTNGGMIPTLAGAGLLAGGQPGRTNVAVPIAETVSAIFHLRKLGMTKNETIRICQSLVETGYQVPDTLLAHVGEKMPGRATWRGRGRKPRTQSANAPHTT